MSVHEPIPLQWFKENLPPQIEVLGLPGIFSPENCVSLSALLDELGERKHVFNFPYPLPEDYDLPGGLVEAVKLALRFKTPTNTAILKRYDINDTYSSAAYEPHIDPVIYRTQRLGLITLSGIADLTVTDSSGTSTTLRCKPGTAFFVDPGVLHSVTEPLNPEGIRDFLFLGYAKSL